MAFEFEIQYTSGKSIPHVDALTRLRFASEDNESDEGLVNEIHWAGESALPWNLVKIETLQDRLLVGIIKRIHPQNALLNQRETVFWLKIL